MKKLAFLILLLTAYALHAQNYPYRRPELLLNKEVKIKELHQLDLQDGYSNFRSDPEGLDIYEEIKYKGSKPEALAGRTFKVTEIKGGKTSFRTAKYVLTLQDDKETIYYTYNIPDNDYYFEVIGGLDVSGDFYCDYVAEVAGEMGEKVYKQTENRIGLMFEKVINTSTKKAEYVLHFNEQSVKPTPKGFGVVIMLDNGQKIDLPKSLVIKDDSAYKAAITLTTAHINLLKSHKITNFKLLEHEGSVTIEQGWLLRGVLQCLLTKN
jgi:hypothetical protein